MSEMRMIQTQEMRNLPLGYLAHVFANYPTISGQLSRVGDLVDYIQDTTGLMKTRRNDPKTALAVASSLAIVVYANPILQLNLEETPVVIKFREALEAKPYCVMNPFHVHYDSMDRPNRPSGLLDISFLGGVIPLGSLHFEQRKSLQSEFHGRVNRLGPELTKLYHWMKHFKYGGLVDACLPLFCGDVPKPEHVALLEKLALEHGSFSQPFPISLAELLPDVSLQNK